MPFTQRQWTFIAIFAVLWTVFMVAWSGDYRIARVAILLVIGCGVALAWGFAMKRFGNWKDQA
jgi:xanthine/uracil permease